MKLAILKLSALGDIVHFALFLPELKARVKNLHVTWFVDERFASLLADSSLVDEVVALPLKKAWKSRSFSAFCKIFKTLKSHGEFDLLVDSQGLLKSALISKLLLAKTRVGFGFLSAKERLAALFYDKRVEIAYSEHILLRNQKLLECAFDMRLDGFSHVIFREESSDKIDALSLDSRADCTPYLDSCVKNPKSDFLEPLPFGYTKEGALRVDSLLCKADGRKKILFILETSKKSKTYPATRFLELAKMCENHQVFLLWHEDEEGANLIAQRSSALKLPRLSLDEVKALVFGVDLVVGGDTGVTHLAFALNTPSITLFGNTPIERFAFFGAKNRVLRAERANMYDKNDLSIATIPAERIAREIEAIL